MVVGFSMFFAFSAFQVMLLPKQYSTAVDIWSVSDLSHGDVGWVAIQILRSFQVGCILGEILGRKVGHASHASFRKGTMKKGTSLPSVMCLELLFLNSVATLALHICPLFGVQFFSQLATASFFRPCSRARTTSTWSVWSPKCWATLQMRISIGCPRHGWKKSTEGTGG